MSHIVPGFPETIDVPKAQARRLVTALKGQTTLTHAQSLEVVAKMYGQESWGHMRAMLDGAKNARKTPAGPSLEVAPQIPDLGHYPTSFPELNGIRLKCLTIDDLASAVIRANDGMFGSKAFSLLYGFFKTKGAGLCVPIPGADGGVIPEILATDLLAGCNDPDLRDPAYPDETYALMMEVIARGILWLHKQDTRKRSDTPYADLVFEALIPEGGSEALERVDPAAYITRRHSILITNHLDSFVEEVENAGYSVHDLSQRRDVTRLARIAGVDADFMPKFHKSVWNIMARAKLGVDNDRTEGGGRIARPHVLIISLTEALAFGGTDLLMAQSRSLGFHVIVHWDLPVEEARSPAEHREIFTITKKIESILHHRKALGVFRARTQAQSPSDGLIARLKKAFSKS